MDRGKRAGPGLVRRECKAIESDPTGARHANIYAEAIIKTVLLIHWDAREAAARVARLEAMGYAASFQNRAGPPLLREITNNPPSAVLIDLSSLPSQGRDVGVALRLSKATRHIPIVFVDGLPEKVLVVRQTLPDAVYSTWTHLGEDLAHAILRPPRNPMVPESVLAGYAGKSPAAKLGIKTGSIVALLGAPPNFTDTLEPLPKGLSIRRQMSEDCDLILWFVRSRRELQDGIGLRAARLATARLWILWPKQTSGQSGDLTQISVRELGLAHSLVDNKIASIDATWSGLLFVRRSP
jgi:hypothetical protein